MCTLLPLIIGLLVCCSKPIVTFAHGKSTHALRTKTFLSPSVVSSFKEIESSSSTNWGHISGESVLSANSMLSEQELRDNAIIDYEIATEQNSYRHEISLTATTSSPTIAPTYMTTETLYPTPCIQDASELIYVNGELSFIENFKLCVANIADPMNIPTIRNGSQTGVQYVYTNIQLNNLHSIDAIAGTASLDFYLRLYWRDNRFNMSVFWAQCSKSIQKDGFDLTRVVDNGDVAFWMPDIRFHDLSEIEALAGTLRVNSSNIFFWSRHVIATFMQPKLEFETYPSDDQYINIRYGSYAFSQTSFKLSFLSSAISLNQNFDKSYTFTTNPLWKYEPDLTTYSQYTSSSGYLNVIYRIRVSRISQGIILRLILPITMLIVVGGFVFWADPGGRVDSTITLLLAVSALYIVILANVPLVGYMTAIDRYVFMMFIVLTIATLIHQTYVTLSDKTDRWPLRIFYLRALETFGRVTIFPAAALLLLLTVDRLTSSMRMIIYLITFPINGCIVLRELPGLLVAWRQATLLLAEKLESDETEIKHVSSMELLAYNVSKHSSFTRDSKFLLIERELSLRRKEELQREKEREIVEHKAAKDKKKKGKKKRKQQSDNSVGEPKELSDITNQDSSCVEQVVQPSGGPSFWNIGILNGRNSVAL